MLYGRFRMFSFSHEAEVLDQLSHEVEDMRTTRHEVEEGDDIEHEAEETNVFGTRWKRMTQATVEILDVN